MNERIKELAEQAGFMLWGKETWNPGDVVDWSARYDEELEKFAELIVRECARVIDRGDGEMSSQAETIWCNVCRDDILKHFGVEE